GLPGVGARAQRDLRRHRLGRGHPHRARLTRGPDQPVRHDDLLPHLPRLPTRRQPPNEGAGPSPRRSRRRRAQHVPGRSLTTRSASPVWVPVLSVSFAVTASVGGILIALGSPVVPISPFVTTISFLIYLVCRLVGSRRMKALDRRRVARAAEEHNTSLAAA